MKNAIEKFNQNYTDYEKGLFLEAFINLDLIQKKSKIDVDVYIFLVKVNRKYPYCVILEYSSDEALYFQAFDDLESAEILYQEVTRLFIN